MLTKPKKTKKNKKKAGAALEARQLPDQCGAITRAWRERLPPSFTLHGTSSSRLAVTAPPPATPTSETVSERQ